MRRTLLILAGMALATTMTTAQSQTIKGTLIDNMCFTAGMSQAELAKHTRQCALDDGCIESGYAVVTADGHVYRLDASGNERIVEALKASSKNADLTVTVTGSTADGTITVAAISLDQ